MLGFLPTANSTTRWVSARCRRRRSRMREPARMAGTLWSGCCGNPFFGRLAGYESSAARRLRGARPRRAGWAAPRRSGSRRESTVGSQSRQFPAHGRDAGADQGMVADEPLREAGQNRREGRQPWPLCHLPDGRSRYCGKSVRRHLADDRGIATAACRIDGAGRPHVPRSLKLTGEARRDDGKFGAFRLSAPRCVVPPPTTIRTGGAELPEARKWVNLARHQPVIW